MISCISVAKLGGIELKEIEDLEYEVKLECQKTGKVMKGLKESGKMKM